MDIQLLTQYIVRQTTVLLAQLSTAAGVRAPLAHIADQVFLDLAREIEAQGVRRNVVADMFGLALRSYQLKVQRLMDTAGVQRSLWRDIYRKLEEASHTRREIAAAFPTVEAKSIAAVLNDLVDSGLAYCSGRGARAVYGVTSDADRERLHAADTEQSLSGLLWLLLATQGAQSRASLAAQLSAEPEVFAAALEKLVTDGRVLRTGLGDEEEFAARSFDIPVGSEEGWEAAVCDHFRAVSNAIAAKLANAQSREDDTIGGTTLTFTVYPQHPNEAEVIGLLQRFRGELNALWETVSAFNQAHVPPDQARRVTFYFGQNITTPIDDNEETPPKSTVVPENPSENPSS